MDLQDLDRRAVRRSVELVGLMKADQLDLPTPCSDWTLRQLLVHMTAQHLGFAAAVEGRGLDLTVWQEQSIDDDPYGRYAAAAERVLDAFSAPEALDREVWLPEVTTAIAFPGRRAIGFHILDYIAHSWDVAVTIGVPTGLDQDLLETGAAFAAQVPVDDSRLRPNALFAPVVAVGGGASAQDRMLGLLGRSPTWPN
jgi:uncharacterized protein (TIGR03086 family)